MHKLCLSSNAKRVRAGTKEKDAEWDVYWHFQIPCPTQKIFWKIINVMIVYANNLRSKTFTGIFTEKYKVMLFVWRRSTAGVWSEIMKIRKHSKKWKASHSPHFHMWCIQANSSSEKKLRNVQTLSNIIQHSLPGSEERSRVKSYFFQHIDQIICLLLWLTWLLFVIYS